MYVCMMHQHQCVNSIEKVSIHMCLGLHAPTILDNHSDECKTESAYRTQWLTQIHTLRKKLCGAMG